MDNRFSRRETWSSASDANGRLRTVWQIPARGGIGALRTAQDGALRTAQDGALRIAHVLRCAGTLILLGGLLAAGGPANAGDQAGVDALKAPAESHEHPEPVVLAPGYAPLTYDAPAAGSYRLPPLGQAPDGRVVATDGTARSLYDLLGDRIVVLSFMYTACSDVNGCPLATHVLGEIQTRILASFPEFTDQIRLVSLSFDPANDTPEVMRAYGARFHQKSFDWQFLTTADERDLAPLLEGFNQWIVRDYDADGAYLGTISHLLRVFLIDRNRQIRNIYSVSFLHADTVINDARTILTPVEP